MRLLYRIAAVQSSRIALITRRFKAAGRRTYLKEIRHDLRSLTTRSDCS